MRWIELEIVVPAPPTEAFPWVVEPGLLKEWLPQLQELRPQGFLHHRPIVRHGALRFELDARVHRVVVPELHELEVTWRGAVARLELEVQAHPDGATVTWRTGLALPPVLRLAGPGVVRELRRVMRDGLERLAERLGEDAADERGSAHPPHGDEPDPGPGSAGPSEAGAPLRDGAPAGNPGSVGREPRTRADPDEQADAEAPADRDGEAGAEVGTSPDGGPAAPRAPR